MVVPLIRKAPEESLVAVNTCPPACDARTCTPASVLVTPLDRCTDTTPLMDPSLTTVTGIGVLCPAATVTENVSNWYPAACTSTW